MSAPFRIAVLASGTGTNLQALIDAISAGDLAVEIAGVFSDKAKAFALERARGAGIATTVVPPKRFATREAHDEAFFAAVDGASADLIVCAGYMRIITAAQIERRPNRMINLHPSLLPAFKGLHTHQQALDAGAIEHGASVHIVTADLDDGPVLAQARVPVLPGDTAGTLAARVQAVEHPLLVETVRMLAEGHLRLAPDGPHLNGAPLPAPLQLGANRRLA
ncbi:MAG: phosphoribosylglycinamide formyltransferase [Xanthomonadaceae bacterium]|nr:phosphoribosylglycinamide formyltransferase [Xanthomonadaceae bacterium]